MLPHISYNKIAHRTRQDRTIPFVPHSMPTFDVLKIMNKDIIPRLLFLAIFWLAIILLSDDTEVFLIADPYDLIVATTILVIGGTVTALLWWLPFGSRKSEPGTIVNASSTAGNSGKQLND